MSQIGIISTGDDEKDRQRLAQAQLFEDRIAAGICPNGCAEMEFETPYSADCPTCGFHLSTNRPYGRRDASDAVN